MSPLGKGVKASGIISQTRTKYGKLRDEQADFVDKIEFADEILKFHTKIDRTNGAKPNFSDFQSSYYQYVLQANLSSLKLNEVPFQLQYLKCLEYLNMSGNNLQSFTISNELCNSLKNIQELNLSNNLIQLFPLAIMNLKKLKILALANNYINQIPDEINELKELNYLDMSHNKLEELPNNLFDLNKLNCLILGNNQLRKIPDQLHYFFELYKLDLSFNRIESIENSKTLENITILDLSFNPIKHPPLEIVRRGGKAIHDYLKDFGASEQQVENLLATKNSIIEAEPEEEVEEKDDKVAKDESSIELLSHQAMKSTNPMLTISPVHHKAPNSNRIQLDRFDLVIALNKNQSRVHVDNNNIENEVKNGTVLLDFIQTLYPNLVDQKRVNFSSIKDGYRRQILSLEKATSNAEYFLAAVRNISKDLTQYCSVNDILNCEFRPIKNLVAAILEQHKK